MEMDISTLKESGLVREGVWSSILEEYRFVFLRYLEIAKDLIALENEFEYIVALKRFIANGWIFKDPAEEPKAIEAGKVLLYRYGAEYSPIAFENAIAQFEAELSVSRAQEKILWQTLVQTVDKIDPVQDYPGYEILGRIWYDDADNQHNLIIRDSASLDRINIYKSVLSEYSLIPLLPYSQEVTFRSYCGSLGLNLASLSLI